MEKALQKFLKKMLSEKYPIYLDVHVSEANRYSPNKKICHEVFLVVIDDEYIEDYAKNENNFEEVKSYIKNLGKYMDVRICDVYKEIVSREEWEEMKSNIED